MAATGRTRRPGVFWAMATAWSPRLNGVRRLNCSDCYRTRKWAGFLISLPTMTQAGVYHGAMAIIQWSEHTPSKRSSSMLRSGGTPILLSSSLNLLIASRVMLASTIVGTSQHPGCCLVGFRPLPALMHLKAKCRLLLLTLRPTVLACVVEVIETLNAVGHLWWSWDCVLQVEPLSPEFMSSFSGLLTSMTMV